MVDTTAVTTADTTPLQSNQESETLGRTEEKKTKEERQRKNRETRRAEKRRQDRDDEAETELMKEEVELPRNNSCFPLKHWDHLHNLTASLVTLDCEGGELGEVKAVDDVEDN